MTTIVRPGVPWGEIYERCLARAGELGHAERFMGARGSQVSFIGHGLGIEIDEPPYLARGFAQDIMETGMTFAFEPKVVFAGEGAIGIENTWVLREQGPEAITCSDEALVVV
jgi:Xaa-Pro dipeptidase